MKKYLIVILTLFLFVPTIVFAEDTTDKLYIDIKVQEDGSLFVRELASLSGSYNGRLRTIEYRNPSAVPFTGQDSDFGGSDIYNGSSIHDVKVYDVLNKDSITFDSLNHLNHQFIRTSSASSGDYGVYTLQNTSNGIDLKIFNPSRNNSAFYIEYVVDDVVVVHQDVAELAWNILGSTYEENVEDMIVKVHLPKSDTSMRTWGHGPLNGNIERTSDEEVTLTYDFLGAYNAIDIRMTFDKSLVPNATKVTSTVAMDKILAYEKQKADEANLEREQIKKQNDMVKAATLIWYGVLIGSILFIYFKYDKEHKTNFDMQYYREFPGEYGPEILEYLLKKNVTTDGFSASILEIIYKKGLKVEEVPDKKKEYKFIKQEGNMQLLTSQEQQIVSLLIDKIGNGKEVTLKEIKQYGKKLAKAQSFIDQYNDWVQDAKIEGKQKNFYLSQIGPKVIGIFISLFGFVVFLLNISLETDFILGYLSIGIGFVALLYFIAFQKRTEQGALEYQKWMAFKRFLLDFGRMDEKTLPEISLWEKYLVYATVLGCAKELEKEMRIKMEHMDINDPRYYGMSDYYTMYFLLHSNLSSTIASTMNQAVSSSRSSIAASQASSSGGFGGGMSSGGGSFGGGGGGGRF